MIDPEELMQLAIDKAREGIGAGQTPFGCAIARDGEILAVAHNTVLASIDITAHAEIGALRAACVKAGAIHLPGAIVATTCEPCPMCMAALHWSRVETVHFGASIADASAAGFNQLKIASHEFTRRGGSEVELIGDILAEACRELFDLWRAAGKGKSY